MSRSPIRTMSPPRSAGSTLVSSATRPPVSSSRRAADLADLVVGQRASRSWRWRGSIPLRWSSRRRNSAATRGSCSIRPRRTRSRTRLRTGWLRSANTRSAASIRCSSGHRRVGERRPSARRPPRWRRRRRARDASLDGPVAEPDLEGGVRVAARRGVAAGHQLVASPAPREPPEPDALPVSARNSSTRRRSRSVAHRLADDPAGSGQGEVGDLAAELADRALLLGVDLGRRALAQPLELGPRRGDVRVARLLGDLLGAGQDVVRLAAGLLERREALGLRGLAVAARLLGVAPGPARSAAAARSASASAARRTASTGSPRRRRSSARRR